MKQDLWFSITGKLINIVIKLERLFLNEPAYRRETRLHANYDKLLHILGSFTALLWLSKFIHPVGSIISVLLLCISKAILNYNSDDSYKPVGDWLANLIGFVLWGLYVFQM